MSRGPFKWRDFDWRWRLLSLLHNRPLHPLARKEQQTDSHPWTPLRPANRKNNHPKLMAANQMSSRKSVPKKTQTSANRTKAIPGEMVLGFAQ
jgi:hypothetical protein